VKRLTLLLHDDEPVFILRGQDIIAPQIVELWAITAGFVHAGQPKVESARRVAAEMRAWQEKHGSKLPD